MNMPFSAIIGQDQAKRSLLCQLVDPQIGGCLLIGPPGCGKTTLARAAAQLLPQGAFVDLPLGCSEERLLGGIDPVAAIEGDRLRWRDGLLGQADGGVCYVDEVNLLPDQITDHLLDVAASGRLVVERDGHSLDQGCRFVLVGSMNPEEGSLRPQLADRFAHQIQLDGVPSRAERRALLQWHLDPQAGPEDQDARDQINIARERLAAIITPDDLLDAISDRCNRLALPGHRRELAVWRTARALTALDGDTTISEAHLAEAWALCARSDDAEDPSESSPPPPEQNTNHGGPTEQQTPQGEPQHPAGAQISQEQIRPCSASTEPLPQPVTQEPRIDLVASLQERIRAKLIGTHPRLRWLPPPQNECWHLVDASRSSARHGGLAAACSRVESILRLPAWARQHLALLHAGSARIRRRIGPGATAHITAGAGATPLATTLEELARHLRRRHGRGERRLEIHSDGLLTPAPGETIATARNRVRAALRRICRATKTTWHIPPLTPRLAAWTTNLLTDLPLTLRYSS